MTKRPDPSPSQGDQQQLLLRHTRALARANQATENAQEHFRLLVDSVRDYGIFLLDSEGYIQSWNIGAERIKGYVADEIIGKHFSTFYAAEDIRRDHPQFELEQALKNGRYEEEGWRIRKDGSRFWASIVITALKDEAGVHVGFAKVTRDLTERKRADDLLKMAYANLEKRVEERTRQLTATNEELKAAVQARDEFLSIASHELRTPITPLRLQIQAIMGHLKRKTLASLPEERIERMSQACDQSLFRLVTLLENLLDVSRINSGKLVLNRESFDLVEMIRDVCERYKSEIASSGSELKFESTHSVVGRFDRLRMEQAFVNLLTNALKYGARKPIRIEVRAEKNQGVLEVHDSGIGIAQSDQERIFERFERVQSGGSIGGLGLGLYISRQVVEAHGGQISVKSGRELGSTFMIVVPLRIEEQP